MYDARRASAHPTNHCPREKSRGWGRGGRGGASHCTGRLREDVARGGNGELILAWIITHNDGYCWRRTGNNYSLHNVHINLTNQTNPAELRQQPWIESFGKSLLDLPQLILFWVIWGFQKLFYEKWIFSQSRIKTSTKTNITKQSKKYPNHRLLVHNLQLTKQKKGKKGRTQ